MTALKKCIYFFLFGMFTILACSNEADIIAPEGEDDPEDRIVTEKDTITYRAHVWVEKADLQRYGGERTFTAHLQEMFHNTNRFWNESDNKFDYYFKFVPGEELYIYDIEGDKNRYDEFKNQAYGNMDTNKYDFVLFLALDAIKGGLSCGGGGASGQSVVMCYTLPSLNIFTDAVYPNQGTYSNLGHEYGHVRGAADMYQYSISAANNRVSNQQYVPPKCNMGTGFRVWSDYCSALFNYTAHQKQLEKDLNKNTFPDELVLTVTKDGKARQGVIVNFYGTRAGGYWGGPDVYDAEGNSPYQVHTTNNEGKIAIQNVYKMYYPDMGGVGVPPKTPKDEFPYSRWYAFLVEIVDRGKKTYMWLPDFDTRTDFLLTGNKTYEINITL